MLVVDDSALVRRLLTDLLSIDPDLEVVSTAAESEAAKASIGDFKPHVITLDLDMARTHGLVWLRRLMSARPAPVLMLSAVTEHEGELTLDALELGVLVAANPAIRSARGLAAQARAAVATLKSAAHSRTRR